MEMNKVQRVSSDSLH